MPTMAATGVREKQDEREGYHLFASGQCCCDSDLLVLATTTCGGFVSVASQRRAKVWFWHKVNLIQPGKLSGLLMKLPAWLLTDPESPTSPLLGAPVEGTSSTLLVTSMPPL